MKTLILRHKATVGVTPIGIVIVHETNDPVLIGDTPLSRTLLDKYVSGVTIPLYDKSSCKLRNYSAPPKDIAKFLDIGAKYFEYADMTLEVIPYHGTGMKKTEVDGVTYELKEI
jgi:hypothetical protein